jgi:hypothetical protein
VVNVMGVGFVVPVTVGTEAPYVIVGDDAVMVAAALLIVSDPFV